MSGAQITLAEGCVAVVTGGGRGIGAEIALRLGAMGARVVAASRDVAACEATVRRLEEAGGEGLAVRADVRVEDDVAAMIDAAVERFGRLDVLVNNAGIVEIGPIEEQTRDRWDNVVAVNLTGTWNAIRFAAPYLKASPAGRVVNISSIAGVIGIPQHGAYGPTKAAIQHMTRQLAFELGPHGVTVNCVAPGPVLTEMTRAVFEEAPEFAAQQLAGTPLKRFASEEDVAWVVAFVASAQAAHVTAQTIVVDGGRTAGIFL